MMNILHINEHLEPIGGVETYLLDLLVKLREIGCDVTVLYSKGEPRPEFGTCYHLPEVAQIGPDARVKCFQVVSQVIHDKRIDVVHIHQTFNISAIRAAVESVPTIIHGHDYRYLCPASSFFYRRGQTICPKTAGIHCFATTVLRKCLTLRPRYAVDYYRRVRWITTQKDRFAAVIAPSESVRDRFAQAGFNPNRIHVLPYYCSIPVRESPRALPDPFTMLFMGRIRPIKGWQYFLQALERLPDVRGILVGDVDHHLASLKRLCSASLNGRLTVRRWAARDAIPALFDQASVFVFPSICPETLGIVGLEAMARGVPVIASNVGGVRQWLHHGENGFLVPPKSPEAIVEAVQRLMHDQTLLLQLGRNAIETIRRDFLPEQHIQKLVAIYRLAASQRLSEPAK